MGMDQFLENQLIGEKELEQNLRPHYIHFERNRAEAIAMDPKVNNERAIKCYEKCGFKR